MYCILLCFVVLHGPSFTRSLSLVRSDHHRPKYFPHHPLCDEEEERETIFDQTYDEMKNEEFFWDEIAKHWIKEATLRHELVTPTKELCRSGKLNATRKKLKCKPRPIIVDIVSTKGKVTPNKIFTKQCGGFCDDSRRKCTPVQSTNTTAWVDVWLDDGTTQCASVVVPMDQKCRCKCSTSAEDCVSKKLDQKTCLCECRNTIEKQHCERKMLIYPNRHFWDRNSCSCGCLNRDSCTTGTLWDPKRCSCYKENDD